MGKTATLDSLALSIRRAEALGDWRGRELAVSAWHRVHRMSERELAIGGYAKRRAARLAPIPLDQRLSHSPSG